MTANPAPASRALHRVEGLFSDRNFGSMTRSLPSGSRMVFSSRNSASWSRTSVDHIEGEREIDSFVEAYPARPRTVCFEAPPPGPCRGSFRVPSQSMPSCRSAAMTFPSPARSFAISMEKKPRSACPGRAPSCRGVCTGPRSSADSEEAPDGIVEAAGEPDRANPLYCYLFAMGNVTPPFCFYQLQYSEAV